MRIDLTYPATELGGVSAYKFEPDRQDGTDSRYSVRDGVLGWGSIVFAYPNPPLPTPRPDYAGRKQLMYGEVFWGYVKYSAEFYDFGVVGEDKFIDITAWNAQPEGYPVLNVTNVGLPTDTSLSVLLPAAIPFLFPALEEHDYRVVALADGDPSIKDNLFIFYDNQADKDLPITGLRIIVFKYSPDWSTEVVQSYMWNTDVLLGKDGTEQRVKLRATPRMSLEFAVLVEGNDAKSLNNLMIAWGDKPFAVPLWMDCCHTLDESLVGQKVINLQDTTGTAAGDTELFYIPYTNKLYEAKSLAVSFSPDGDFISNTINWVSVLTVNKTYTIPDVGVITAQFNVTLPVDAVLTIRTGDNLLLGTFNNEVVDKEYIVRGDTIKLEVTFSAVGGVDYDVIVLVKDNSEITSITVGNDLLDYIPAGVVAYPCVIAYITTIDEYKTHTDSVRGLSLIFSSEVLPEFLEVITEAQYKGALVKHTDPLWNYGQKQDLSSSLFIHDYKTGIIGAGSTNNYISGKLERSDAYTDKRSIKHFKNELQHLSGKYVSFWLPSFNSDINITVATGTNDTVFTIESANNKILFDKTTAYHDVMIIMNDGTIYYREILSMVESGDDELMELDIALGVPYAVGDFRRICYMSLVRSNSDAVTLVWKNATLMTVSQALTSINQ